MLALQAQQAVALHPLKAFVAPLGAGTNRHAMKLARELRAAGVAVDVGDESFRLKKSFETAEKLGAAFVVLVGENEVGCRRVRGQGVEDRPADDGGAQRAGGVFRA